VKAHIDRILYASQTDGMKTVSYTDARNQLAQLMATASDDREPVTITRNGAAAAVLIDAAEWSSIQETLRLLASPANAKRLHKGLREFTAGKFTERRPAKIRRR
jgi:antitoxin YefM